MTTATCPEKMRRRFPLHSVIALAICLGSAAPVQAQQVTGEEVRAAMKAAMGWLEDRQGADGKWSDYSSYTGGTTALVTLAMLNAGTSPMDDRMRRAINAVRAIPLDRTYVVALKASALAAADPIRYQPEIKEAANWLVRAQREDGRWGYKLQGGDADFSNTQFALLGLHEAGIAGVPITPSVWTRAQIAWLRAQRGDGSWSYRSPNMPGTGSMTTAGIASLYITGNSLSMNAGPKKGPDGEPVCCGQYGQFQPIARGLRWLDLNWSAQRNPGSGGWFYYYLYGVERVGILSGLRYIGTHDWYREGAARLVRLQKSDGSWREFHPIVDTAFGLLFLAKGHRSVLFHKLRWSENNDWNLVRNDLNRLVAFMGDRLGQPVSWETIGLDADLDEWLRAPILYFNGSECPKFNPDEMDKLRQFVREGGTILAVASCRPLFFRKGFTRFAAEAFPEAPFVRLPPDHPVYSAVFELDGNTVPLYGVVSGCRTSVFLCPQDVACYWELVDLPGLSRQAFELGTNIAAYATGLEPLPDKLDVARTAGSSEDDRPDRPPPRGALFIAQLMHNGDWRPNPRAIPQLAEYLNEDLGVDVVPRAEPLRLTDPKLARHPILYMTGHFSFELSDDEVDALRKHLQRGGFLLANACCGREAFDVSFRQLAARLFPEHPLDSLPADHPVVAGKPGLPLDEISYRPSTLAELPDLAGPQLEGITIDGRTVVVYSRFSLDCGLDGHACFACRGVAPPDALRTAGNAILYALSY